MSEAAGGSVHAMDLRKEFFDLVANGAKTVEVRVASPAKLAIRAGDFIRFTSAGESLVARVIRTTRYPDFPTLIADEDPGAINPRTDRAGLLRILRELYSPQRERLGALAIEIRRVSHEAAAVRARTEEPC